MENGTNEINWTFEELEDIQRLMERSRYSHADRLLVYDLYNRIFKIKKSPSSCGKCMVNTLNALRRKYEDERTKRNQ